MIDRGDSYRVEYLGSAMLNSVGTGLGVLQKPLRELYFGFRHAGKSAKLQERHLTMTSKGMTMTFKERRDKTVQELFYGVPSMLSWDAVEFVTVKGPDKKVRGAFEPIDNDISRNKDNLFSIVDKKYHFLQQMRHPPLFCVVLRRTQGVKALDVHAFVCSNDDEALGLVRALNLVQNNYNMNESHETGVFAYNPFGKESVRSAAGFDRQTGSGGRKSHHGSPHGGSLENPKPVRVLPREAPVRTQSQRHPGEFYAESNMVRARSVTNLASSGIFQLTQEDFLQGATPKSKTAEDLNLLDDDDHHHHKHKHNRREADDRYEYAERIERSLERNRQTTSGANDFADLQRQRPVSEVHNLRSVSKQSPTPYRRSAHSPQYGRAFDAVHDIDIGEPVPPPTRELRDSPREARYTADSKTGQGYGLLSSSQGPLPGYAPRLEGEDSLQRKYEENDSPYSGARARTRSPSYQKSLPRNSSPPREGVFVEDRGHHRGATRDSPPRDHHRWSPREETPKAEQLRRTVPVGGQKVFPVGREPPPTPPQNLRPTTLERVTGNPVRRSPSSPAGVRPPPSGSRSPGRGVYDSRDNLPLSGRNTRDNSQPEAESRSNGKSSPGGDDMRSKRSNAPPGRGFNSKGSPGTPNKPVAMVTPQKIHGIQVLPMMPVKAQQRPPQNNTDDSSPTKSGPRSKSKIFDSREDSDYKYDRPSGSAGSKAQQREEPATYSSGKKSSKQKNTQKLRNELSGNWQFNKPKEDKDKKSDGNSDGQDSEGSSMNEKLLLTKKKDAEIASVMQNLRFEYNDSTISPHGTNFERSLGYFP